LGDLNLVMRNEIIRCSKWCLIILDESNQSDLALIIAKRLVFTETVGDLFLVARGSRLSI
jgi:hypothetical protein